MNRKYSFILYDSKSDPGPGQEIGRLEGAVLPYIDQRIWYDGCLYYVSEVIPCYDTGVLGVVAKSPVGDGGRPDALVLASKAIYSFDQVRRHELFEPAKRPESQ